LELLKDAVASDTLSREELLEAVNLAQTHADFQDTLENLQPLNDWAREQYSKILQGTWKEAMKSIVALTDKKVFFR
jgi:hypothetical protein